MKKEWYYLPLPSPDQVATLQACLPISEPTTHLLLQRNIEDIASAKKFFKPSLGDLYDPFLMKGMKKVIEKINDSIEKKEHIRIYGDYDVDGTTSVALFCTVLEQLGARVSYYIPDRYQEGYGVSQKGIDRAVSDQVDLLVCVDCGTRAIEQLERAGKANMEVIVCDHHEPGDRLPPALAILNPKQVDCHYPFRELSACGIVFKVLQALIQEKYNDYIDLSDYLDLVVLSIAADIVPMIDENRILAHCGLFKLNEKSSLGIAALKKLSKPNQKLVISDVVFGLAPYINASGRMEHAHTSVELLMATCPKKAEEIALTLQEYNITRKKKDEELIQEALKTIEQEQTSSATTVLLNEKWSKGLVGIGAARCIEHHYRPTILLTREGDQVVGSARSVTGYNIYEALKKCEKWLTRYGGHAYAAGLSLPYRHFLDFKKEFEQVVNETWDIKDRTPQQVVDLQLTFAELTPRFCNTLERMRPFGPSNRQPVFATKPVIATWNAVYRDQHLALTLRDETTRQLWNAIGFNMADYLPIVENRQQFAIAYKVEKQIYKGIVSRQLIIKDLKPYI